MQKSVVEVLENFVNYDFLEMAEAKKKVSSNVIECDSQKSKIDVLRNSKKSDQSKIAQVWLSIKLFAKAISHRQLIDSNSIV
jgi:hypothetical protein